MPKTIDMLATIAMLTVTSLHFWLLWLMQYTLLQGISLQKPFYKLTNDPILGAWAADRRGQTRISCGSDCIRLPDAAACGQGRSLSGSTKRTSPGRLFNCRATRFLLILMSQFKFRFRLRGAQRTAAPAKAKSMFISRRRCHAVCPSPTPVLSFHHSPLAPVFFFVGCSVRRIVIAISRTFKVNIGFCFSLQVIPLHKRQTSHAEC